jgi:hypothetical protein
MSDTQINEIILNKNIFKLKQLLSSRERLNKINVYIVYLFHLLQVSGIILSSYGTTIKNDNIIWLGIFLNFLASLFERYEKVNNALIKKMSVNITGIQKNKYYEESEIIENSLCEIKTIKKYKNNNIENNYNDNLTKLEENNTDNVEKCKNINIQIIDIECNNNKIVKLEENNTDNDSFEKYF